MSVFRGQRALVPTPGHVSFEKQEWQIAAADELIIAMKMAALCGSDYHIFKGQHPSAPLPMWLGHEMAGVVVAVGSAVQKVKVGDRVCVEPNLVCGTCDACQTGRYNLCETITFAYRQGDGAMADYIKVKERMAHKLPDALTFAEGALIEPLAVAVHAVRQAAVALGDRVLVIGGGPIGVLVGAVAKRAGAHVTLSDSNVPRQKLALDFGLDQVVERGAPGVSGFDACFDCAGSAVSLNRAIQVVKPGGTLAVVGIASADLTLDFKRVITAELQIVGVQGYCHDFPLALALAPTLQLERLITHVYPLQELAQALVTGLDRATGSMKVAIKGRDME